jgi:hypothetical protein
VGERGGVYIVVGMEWIDGVERITGLERSAATVGGGGGVRTATRGAGGGGTAGWARAPVGLPGPGACTTCLHVFHRTLCVLRAGRKEGGGKRSEEVKLVFMVGMVR